MVSSLAAEVLSIRRRKLRDRPEVSDRGHEVIGTLYIDRQTIVFST